MPRYLTLFRVVFALILAMTSICQQAAADQKSVGVSYSRTLSTVSENTVRLGDLFTNTGGKSDTVVDQAPPPGGEAIYDVHRLASIARAHGLVWQAQSWSERVVVKRQGQVVGPDEIRAAIIAALENKGISGKWELELTTRHPRLVVPVDQPAAARVVHFDFRRRSGRFVATVASDAGRSHASRITVSGRIHKVIDVPTLNRRIKAGDIIRRHDIHWVTMRRSQVNRNVIVDGDQLIGMTPKRFVPAGRKVRMGDIRHPRLIKKGAIVTMVLSTPKMVLTSKGRALEHGARGETIKVMNLKSKTVIEAEITGPNSVRINAEMSPSVISTARR